MTTLLFFIQQLLFPFVHFWPVGVVVTLVYFGLRLKAYNGIAQWLARFSLGVCFLLIILRAVFMYAFPLRSQITSIPATTLELPLYVFFQRGKFVVNHNQAEGFSLQSFDVSEGYVLEKGTHRANIGNAPTFTEAILVRRKQEMNIFTSVYANVTLSLPPTFKGSEEYVFYETEGLVDFTNSLVSSVSLSAFISDIEVRLPKTTGEKKYFFQFESTKGSIYIQEGPTYIFNVNTALPITFPSGFQKVEGSTYKREGSPESVITVNISSRIPRSLEVMSINEHNK